MVTVNDIQDRDIVVFGTGIMAIRCTHYFEKRGITVKNYFNNGNVLKTFMSRPVYDIKEQNIQNSDYIIVAVINISDYIAISGQLSAIGMKEFKDFIYYGWLDKKLVLLHGNCHMIVIKKFLQSSKNFCDKYAIYPNPLICENKNSKIEDTVLENCDLWIHEDIRANNSYGYQLSDEFLRKKINGFNHRGGVQEIVIPHLFGLGKGFFPQSGGENKNNSCMSNGQDHSGMFPYADNAIEKCVERGMSVEDTVSFCKSGNVFRKDEVINNFENYMKRIKEREIAWDIKIYDFIMLHYKYEKLFYDEGHPTNIVLKKIAYEILQRLDIEENIYSDVRLDYHECPVYPEVKKYLELKWDDKELRKSPYAKKFSVKMDFEGYVKEYLMWCYLKME